MRARLGSTRERHDGLASLAALARPRGMALQHKHVADTESDADTSVAAPLQPHLSVQQLLQSRNRTVKEPLAQNALQPEGKHRERPVGLVALLVPDARAPAHVKAIRRLTGALPRARWQRAARRA